MKTITIHTFIHPVRDRRRVRDASFVVQLADGRLWKERGANQAAVFGSLENARRTIASTKIEALKRGKPMRIAATHEEGARFTEGYWIASPGGSHDASRRAKDAVPGSEKPFAIFCLNNFGTGGHPVATLQNLDLFGDDYIKQCVRRAIKSGKINPKYAKSPLADSAGKK